MDHTSRWVGWRARFRRLLGGVGRGSRAAPPRSEAGFRTIKVFISSTFRDMQAERDHLTRFVFPRLRQELLARRIHLEEVDLRWGVTSDENVVEACRDIIDECRPRFVCILGGRYGTIPKGHTRSITEEEVRYAALGRAGVQPFAFFYFRDDPATARAEAGTGSGIFADAPGSRAAAALSRLKSSIARSYRPRAYRSSWNPALQRFTGLQDFGRAVYDDLLGSIDQELGPPSDSPSSVHAEDRAATYAYITEQESGFVLGNRTEQLADVRAALTAHPPALVCVVGPAGCGKSAFMAALFRSLAAGGEAERSLVPIPIFVGRGIDSSDDQAIARVVCRELQALTNEHLPLPDEPEALRRLLANLLPKVARTHRAVVLVDGLDNVERRSGAPLDWYPIIAPSEVRVVVSCRPGAALDALRAEHRLLHSVELRVLADADRRNIAERFLRRYGKRLEPAQVDVLLTHAADASPLYLRAVLEELRTLGIRSEIDAHLARLPRSIHDLFRQILKRLGRDPGLLGPDDTIVGDQLVPRVASLLAASRSGLSPSEIVELTDPGDPRGNVAAVLALLRPYLMRRDELIDFFHDELRQAAVAQTSDMCSAHRSLADLFEKAADPERNRTWLGTAPRSFRELTWHLAEAEPATLESTLCDQGFVAAKIAHGLVFELVSDYRRAAVRAASAEGRADMALMERFFLLAASPLAGDPTQLATQLCGRLAHLGTPVPRMLVAACRKSQSDAWLEPCVATLITPDAGDSFWLAGHQQFVSAVRVDATGRTAVSGSSDRRLIVWDLALGRLIRELRGHRAGVTAVDLTPDGTLALSGSHDLHLRLWSVRGGHCLHVLEGHHVGPKGVALSSDGAVGASVATDEGLVRVWDLRAGHEIFSHPVPAPVDVVITPDGRGMVVRSGDGALRAFDLASCRALGQLPVRSAGIGVGTTVAMSRDGELLAWSNKRGVGLWNGSEAESFDGGAPCYVGFGPRNELCWAADDRELRVVDVRRGMERESYCLPAGGRLAALWRDGSRWRTIVKDDRYLQVSSAGQPTTGRASYDERIVGVAIASDGRTAVSASANGTIRSWDPHSGAPIRTVRDEASPVVAVALSRDGTVAAAIDRHGGLRVWPLTAPDRPWTADAGRKSLMVDGIPNQFGITVMRTGELTAIALSRDGRRVLVGSADRQISVWSFADRTHLYDLEGHAFGLSAVAIDGAGRRALSASDTTVRLWDLDGRTSTVLSRERRTISSVALSDAGDLAVCASGMVATLWKTAPTRDVVASLAHPARILAVAVSDDARTVVCATTDWSVRVWRPCGVGEWRCIARFTGDSEVRTCGISSDGRMIVAGEDSGRVHFLRVHRPSD